MNPLLLVGFLVVAIGVFVEAAKGTPATKVIKIEHKKKEAESVPKKKENAPAASDSED